MRSAPHGTGAASVPAVRRTISAPCAARRVGDLGGASAANDGDHGTRVSRAREARVTGCEVAQSPEKAENDPPLPTVPPVSFTMWVMEPEASETVIM